MERRAFRVSSPAFALALRTTWVGPRGVGSFSVSAMRSTWGYHAIGFRSDGTAILGKPAITMSVR